LGHLQNLRGTWAEAVKLARAQGHRV
jgi:hypothetical protein